MKKRVIPAVALMAAVMSGGAFPAHAFLADTMNNSEIETVANPDYAAAIEEYNRLLAVYRKDMAAYEADPGEWTVEIPRMPPRPVVPATITRQRRAASAPI